MNDLYFPNQPSWLLEQERLYRKIAARLPECDRYEMYSILSACVDSFTNTSFRIDPDVAVASQAGREIAFPRPIPTVKLALLVFGYEEWLTRKYALPGFVEVEAGDIVVDCGAYVGGFSLGAASLARQLFAFEPDAANADCARRNLAGFDNVEVVDAGLYDRSDEMTLNRSANSVEHSLLKPDDGDIVEKRRIPVVSLGDWARSRDIQAYDFVKIEAEGVELEVFAGLEDMRPRKLAIDVSPERDGQSPAAEFRARLEPMGYEVRQRKQVMFAWMRND